MQEFQCDPSPDKDQNTVFKDFHSVPSSDTPMFNSLTMSIVRKASRSTHQRFSIRDRLEARTCRPFFRTQQRNGRAGRDGAGDSGRSGGGGALLQLLNTQFPGADQGRDAGPGLSLCLCLSLSFVSHLLSSLSLSHSLSHSPCLSLTLSLSLCLSPSLSLSLSLSLCLCLSLSLSHSLSVSLCLSHSLSPFLSHPLSPSLSVSLTLSLTHTHRHTHTDKIGEFPPPASYSGYAYDSPLSIVRSNFFF